jgi:hypothetical protein
MTTILWKDILASQTCCDNTVWFLAHVVKAAVALLESCPNLLQHLWFVRTTAGAI